MTTEQIIVLIISLVVCIGAFYAVSLTKEDSESPEREDVVTGPGAQQ